MNFADYPQQLEPHKVPGCLEYLIVRYCKCQQVIHNYLEKIFDEILKPMGIRPKGIRLDSGDLLLVKLWFLLTALEQQDL